MPRVIVLGGGGFFGSVATDCLQAEGFTPVRSSRRPGVFELQVDANDAESIRSSLRPGDIVLDAAGPFQSRTTALVTAATEVGFDVVDLSDSFAYAARILAMLGLPGSGLEGHGESGDDSLLSRFGRKARDGAS